MLGSRQDMLVDFYAIYLYVTIILRNSIQNLHHRQIILIDFIEYKTEIAKDQDKTTIVIF